MSRTSVMKYIARVINQVAISIILYDWLCCLWFFNIQDQKFRRYGMCDKRWWCFQFRNDFCFIFEKRTAKQQDKRWFAFKDVVERDVERLFVWAEESMVLWISEIYGYWVDLVDGGWEWLNLFSFVLVIVQKNI